MKTIRTPITIIILLLIGIIVASAQDSINAVQAATSGTAVPFLSHFAGIYGILTVAVAWATHANWGRILAAYEWIGAQGGVFGILRKVAIGKKVAIGLLCGICGLSSGCNTTRFEATRSDGTKISVVNRRFFWSTESYSCEIGTNSASLTASKSTADSAAIAAAAAGAVEGAAKILNK